MRSAIIGTGGIARTHADAIRSLGHTVALVVGHSRSGAETFARQYDCPCFTDQLTAELLDGVDCVHICTPPASHGEFIRLCLAAGKHILCEKPLSLVPEEAQALAALAEASGAVTAVNFNNRFYPACGRVRAEVERLGPVVLVQGHYCQEFDILPTAYSWRYRDELRAVSEIGSHFIDLMRWLTGLEVEAVSASFLNATPQRYVRDGILYADASGTLVTVPSEDAAAVIFRLTGGALASAVFSEISPGRSNDLHIEISSPNRSVSWSAEQPYQIVSGAKGEGLTCRCDAFGGGFTDTFRDCFAAFYRAVETGVRDNRLATFADGAVNAAICAAMAASARAGGNFREVKR